MGGSIEPIGKDFDGSSVKVINGADFVPGLADAVTKMQPSPEARSK
jgi:hypothetical protein